jgi:transketolase
MRSGTDVTVVACGAVVLHAVEASKILEHEDGLSVRVINLHTIKPIDQDAILSAVRQTRRIVTFEDHNTHGGLGSAVAEVIAESGAACAFQRVGIPDTYTIIGYPEDIMNYYKLDADGIVEKVRQIMGRDFEADEDREDEDWEDET